MLAGAPSLHLPRLQVGGPPGAGRDTWLGSSLPASCLPLSGLLYLNDDFQGGDLFFTEPNALTVTVTGGPGGREEQSPAIGWDSKQRVPRSKCSEMAGAAFVAVV